MAKNYMLITVEDREIMTEQFDTVEAAREVMHEEMKMWCGIPQEIFDAYPEEYCCDDFAYGAAGGFAQGEKELDWSIVAL